MVYVFIVGFSFEFDCSYLLSFPNNGYINCLWLNESYLVLSNVLNNVNLLPDPGQDISIINGTYHAACISNNLLRCDEYPSNPFQETTILPPNDPIKPTVVLSFPSQIGPCSDIQLDATGSFGSGGKPWIVQWTISPSQTKEDLTSYLNINGSDISNLITIKNDLLLRDTVFTVSLQLTNFFGLSSIQTSSFTVLPLSKANFPSVISYIYCYTFKFRPYQV